MPYLFQLAHFSSNIKLLFLNLGTFVCFIYFLKILIIFFFFFFRLFQKPWEKLLWKEISFACGFFIFKWIASLFVSTLIP
jgi:hypothetical protein